MVLQTGNGSFCVVSFLNMPFKSLIHIVMEGVFKSKRIFLTSSLYSDSQCSHNGSVVSPRVRYQSSSIEKSWSNNSGFEVLLNSAFLNSPVNDLDIRIWVVSNLNLMKSIAIPVVALSDVSVVEIEVCVVVVSEVIGGIDIRSEHVIKL